MQSGSLFYYPVIYYDILLKTWSYTHFILIIKTMAKIDILYLLPFHWKMNCIWIRLDIFKIFFTSK